MLSNIYANYSKRDYATDPKYTDKVMGIYQGNTMSAFAPEMTLAMNE